ncbi:MAG: hypothetical protein LBE09_02970 [Christensenellaceae bacterium]|jgi:hypothetical protein|nr:hypothetical protein [Christensenellaceae bacterium]
MKMKRHDMKNEFAVNFYKLWYKLIYWINEKYKIVRSFPVPIYGQSVNEEPIIEIRQNLWDNPQQYIVEFLCSSAASDLSVEECQTISTWAYKFIKGRFLIHEHLAEYSVFEYFEQSREVIKLYGVRSMTNTIYDVLCRRDPPILVETVLLPFEGKIVYDTFIASHNIAFSESVKKNLKKLYNEAYAKYGIITTL